MALVFGDGTTNKVTITNPLTFGAGTTFSVCWWLQQRFLPAANSHGTSKGTTCDLLVYNTVSVAWFMEVLRATTNAHIDITDANLFPDTGWTFLAHTYSEGNGCKIYRGNLTTVPAEVSYVTQTVGVGNTTANSGDLWVGNRSAAGALSVDHNIAVFMLFNTELTLGDIRRQWMWPHMDTGCIVFQHLGFNGTGTQTDWSGAGNSGAVTGATVGDHVPLMPFTMPTTIRPYVPGAVIASRIPSQFMILGMG